MADMSDEQDFSVFTRISQFLAVAAGTNQYSDECAAAAADDDTVDEDDGNNESDK